jgi:diguanylate cyclase (GGDEF)-like protein
MMRSALLGAAGCLLLLCNTFAAGTGTAAESSRSPGTRFSQASLAARVKLLTQDQSRPPAEVLRDVLSLAPMLANAPLRVQDGAQLTQIDILLHLGKVNEAELIADGMQADRQRSDPAALSRAELAALRIELYKSDVTAAVTRARRVLAQRAAWGGDEFEIEALGFIASALHRGGDNTSSVALLVEAIAIAERTGAEHRKPRLLDSLCALNYVLRNLPKALEYCQQARALAEVFDDKIVLSEIASDTANVLSEMGDFDGQLREMRASLALARALGLKRGEAVALVNLSDHALQAKDWKLAAEQARASLTIAREISDRAVTAVGQMNLAEALSNMGNVTGAIKVAEEGLKEAEATGDLQYLVELLPAVAEMYARAGKLPEALNAFRRRVAEGEKLYQRSQASAFAEMQTRFDAAQREQEILLLKRENQLKSATLEAHQLQQWGALLIVTLSALLGWLLYQAYRRIRLSNLALAVSNSQLAEQSHRDPLTGLFNRRAFQLFLQLSTQGSRLQDPLRPTMAFVLLDIDHFKPVNDSHGHAAGDAVLVEFARRLTALVRPGDRLFRWGGEEFLLLLPQWPTHGLGDVCKRILQAVAREPFEVEGKRIPLTVSLGACPFPLHPDASVAQDWERHLRWADLALYLSKSRGRNRAHDITGVAEASPATWAAIDGDLGAAMAQGAVSVAMIQPE